MTIKTKVALLIVLAGLITVLVGGSVYLALRATREGMREVSLYYDLTNKVLALTTLSEAYLRDPQERTKAQWDATYASLRELIAGIESAQPREHTAVESLRREYEKVGTTFALLTGEGSPVNGEPGAASVRRRLTDQVSVTLGVMVDKVSLLLDGSKERIATGQAWASLITVLLVVGLILTSSAAMLLILRRLSHSILTLREGTRRIAGGQLDYRIATGEEDELADLARDFNGMTAHLQRSYAELETEVRERERVAQELLRANSSLAESLADRETLLREVHHRTKNNLQMLCDMLYLEAELLEDPAGRAVLEKSYTRVYAFARLHEQLHRSLRGGTIDFGKYLAGIVEGFRQVYPDTTIRLDLPPDPLTFDLDRTLHVGLILNELVTNAVQHAYPSGVTGEVGIAVRVKDHHMQLRVWDTGQGLPADFDPQTVSTLGLRIVHILARSLQADVDIGTGGGTKVTITVPLSAQ